MGENDFVKCNGELQNWDNNNCSWFEQAKWYLLCEFLLKERCYGCCGKKRECKETDFELF